MFGRLFRRGQQAPGQEAINPAALREATAAAMPSPPPPPPPAAVAPPAAPAVPTGPSARELEAMQRITDIISIMHGGTEHCTQMVESFQSRNMPAFIEVTSGFMLRGEQSVSHDRDKNTYTVMDAGIAGGYGEALSTPMSTLNALTMINKGVSDKLARYIGEDPKYQTVEANPNHARGSINRLARVMELIETADGDRRDFLVATATKMFDHAAKNPHFQAALAGDLAGTTADRSAASMIKSKLATIEREPHQAASGVAGQTLDPAEKVLLDLGLSWQSKSPPKFLQQPPYPQDASQADQDLYRTFNYQKNVVSISTDGGPVTGLKRDQLAINDTLSQYAHDTDRDYKYAPQPQREQFQTEVLTRLTALGVTGPKEAYPQAFQNHVAKIVEKYAPPAPGQNGGGGPTSRVAALAARP